MNTAISFEPETLTVEENLLAEMLRAADVVGEIYGVENSELSLTLTDDEHIHALNKKYRGVDRATDVLSFAFRESDEPEVVDAGFEILGDVIISLERAATLSCAKLFFWKCTGCYICWATTTLTTTSGGKWKRSNVL